MSNNDMAFLLEKRCVAHRRNAMGEEKPEEEPMGEDFRLRLSVYDLLRSTTLAQCSVSRTKVIIRRSENLIVIDHPDEMEGEGFR